MDEWSLFARRGVPITRRREGLPTTVTEPQRGALPADHQTPDPWEFAAHFQAKRHHPRGDYHAPRIPDILRDWGAVATCPAEAYTE